MKEELNLIEIIKSQRVLKSALSRLLPPQTLKEIEKGSRYKTIDLDKSSAEQEQNGLSKTKEDHSNSSLIDIEDSFVP